MAGRKRRFSIPGQYKLIGFFFIPFILFPFYTHFVNFFGERITLLLFAATILWVAYKLVVKAKYFIPVKNHGRKIYSSVIRATISKIPTVIWGAFAVFGIFLFGFLMGDAVTGEFTPENKTKYEKRIAEYKDVIEAYQSISRLFYLQGQDMEIITNVNSWESRPEELRDALSSYEQKRDEIIFELGRLYEVRTRASLPDDPYFKTE